MPGVESLGPRCRGPRRFEKDEVLDLGTGPGFRRNAAGLPVEVISGRTEDLDKLQPGASCWCFRQVTMSNSPRRPLTVR